MAMTSVFRGSHGVLLLAQESGPEGADAEAILNTYEIALEIGRVTNVELYVETDLEEFHELGRRHAVSLHPGNIHISGKIERAYVNGALLWLLLGRGVAAATHREPYVQPAMFMNVVLADPAVPGNRAILNVSGVKFDNWAYTLPEDDFVMENVTFKALRLNVQDEEAPAAGGAATVKSPTFPGAATP